MAWTATFIKDDDKEAGSLSATFEDDQLYPVPFTYSERVETDDLRLAKFSNNAKQAKIVEDQKRQEQLNIKIKVESILNG